MVAVIPGAHTQCTHCTHRKM